MATIVIDIRIGSDDRTSTASRARIADATRRR
jgi:hypothetical protein